MSGSPNRQSLIRYLVILDVALLIALIAYFGLTEFRTSVQVASGMKIAQIDLDQAFNSLPATIYEADLFSSTEAKPPLIGDLATLSEGLKDVDVDWAMLQETYPEFFNQDQSVERVISVNRTDSPTVIHDPRVQYWNERLSPMSYSLAGEKVGKWWRPEIIGAPSAPVVE